MKLAGYVVKKNVALHLTLYSKINPRQSKCGIENIKKSETYLGKE